MLPTLRKMNLSRRNLFRMALGAPASTFLANFALRAEPARRKVKIAAIKTLQLDNVGGGCLVKIETDSGRAGYGESGVTPAMARTRIATIERDLIGQDPLAIALLIDATPFEGQQMIAALGIDQDGWKTILGIRQGATENATVVGELLGELMNRGLDFTQPRLYVLGGGKALHAAVKKYAGESAPVQRCQVHIAGRDPLFQRGGMSPPGQVPASPVAWGQA